MKRLPLGSLRLRLMLLVILAVIPAVGLLVWSNLRDRQQDIAHARVEVLQAARQASWSESRIIGQARQLFMTLSHFPQVLHRESAAISRIFAQLMESTEGYSAFLATDPAGTSFATFPPKKSSVDLSDRQYFKEALKTGQFALGNYVLGRVSGKPVLTMAYPVKNAEGKITAVLVAGIKTDWLGQLLSQSQLPATANLSIIDGQGRLLAHNPPEPDLIGKPQFSEAAIKSIAAHGQGIYEGADAHGNRRLYGYTKLGKESGAIYVLFSVPEEEIFAEANRILIRDLALAAAAALLALLVAWFMGTASVVRPVARLLKVTQRVAAGDLDARAGDESGSGELGLLAKSFDQMAEALQQRQQEQEQAQRDLHESEVRFQTVADFTYDWEWWRGMDSGFIYVSPSCKRITGYAAEEFLEDSGLLLRIVHPQDREMVAVHLENDLNHDDPIELDFRIITRDGRELWLEHISQPVFGPDGERMGRRASNRDGTERKRAEEALAHKSRVDAGKTKIFRDALTCENEEELARSALGVAEELTGSAFGFIGEVNSEGRFDTIGISNPGWKACEMAGSTATTLIRGMEMRGIWAKVIKTGAPLMVDNPSAHPDSAGVPAGHPELTSFLGVPLIGDNRAVGMIALANKKGGYQARDREAAEALAAVFYETLLRKRLEDQVLTQAKIKEAQAELSELISGNQEVEPLSEKAITYLCQRLGASVGLMYVADDQGRLNLAGSYAFRRPEESWRQYAPGEGLVGQAALDQKPLALGQVPENYYSIESGLGEVRPGYVLIHPIVYNERVHGVLELGFLHQPTGDQAAILEAVNQNLAAAVDGAQAREVQARLLEESQQMAEELQSQQEELKNTNEELEEQTRLLRSSEEKLKTQQEELQVTNEELEEKNELLGRQKMEVELARGDLQEKAAELALASKYKSEFLANMSHELRTPLNSLLLLAQALSDNKEGNLSKEQVEFAQIIHGSGSDLLNLINEILDLAKIEAGRIELRPAEVATEDLVRGVRASFEHMAAQKGLELKVTVGPQAPARMYSDRQRIEQILKNLVANAIKFTEEGQVEVSFQPPRPDLNRSKLGLDEGDYLAVAVADTGIGIDPKEQRVIFEAFQQVDGSTSRRYGGTGLGLSISRELAHLLGGAIEVQSKPGKGSTFTVYLPLTAPSQKAAPEWPAAAAAGHQAQERSVPVWREAKSPAAAPESQIEDDRESISSGDRVILIIEDDPKFAKILYSKCHDKGFKCLAAPSGEAGLELAREHLPDAAILDLHLPGLDGWSVLEAMKEDTRTRHIPVHIMSVEQATSESLRKGAVGHATKPLDSQGLEAAFAKLEQMAARGTKRVLVVEDDDQLRSNSVSILGGGDVEVDEADTAARAMEALRGQHYDCIVLDLGLPDMDGREMLERLQKEGMEIPPVIVYTARDMTREEEAALRENTESIIIKGVRSQERLLDEVSLFLHRMVSEMPARKRQIIRNLHDSEAMLLGKKVLVVDDDMRTTFAVAALLSELGMEVLKANNGQKALKVLEDNPEVDLVLMDIMMPVLDGYQAMEAIRDQARFQDLPIIALTAKAMPVDREKCLRAGASDYLPKPVDREKLISMIRVWLYR